MRKQGQTLLGHGLTFVQRQWFPANKTPLCVTVNYTPLLSQANVAKDSSVSCKLHMLDLV